MDQIEIINNTVELGEGLKIIHPFNTIFWILIFINLIIFAHVKTTYRGYLSALFKTSINNRQILGNSRETLQFQRLSSVLLNFTYFNAVAIIIWKVAQLKNQELMLLISAVLIGLAALKFVLIKFISTLSQQPAGLVEHGLNHLVFFQVGGIILTFILIFTHYIPEEYLFLVHTLLVGTTVLLIVLREFHSFKRATQSHVAIFYIILYLCTLEIMPLLVLFRIFIIN